MNKYFIQLFLRENTVILPGFGALTAPNGNLEEIMFVPYLTDDDGKLADFIVETEGIDRQDAQNTIAKFIREMEAKLSKGESFDIFEFGSFSKNETGEIEFQSWVKPKELKENSEETQKETEEVLVSETTFFPPIVPIEEQEEISIRQESLEDPVSETVIEKSQQVSTEEATDKSIEPPLVFDLPQNEQSKKPEPVRVQKKKKKKFGFAFWFLNLLSLLVIVGGIYTYFNYDKVKQYIPFLEKNKNINLAEKNSVEESKDTLPPENSTSSENEKPKVEPKTEKKKPLKPSTPPAVNQVVSSEATGFFLIGGVFTTEIAAQKKVYQLIKDGVDASVFPQKKNSVYVSLGNFTDRKIANEKLKELRDKGLKVWVLEK